MTQDHPVPLIFASAIALPNFAVQAAITAGSDLAAWGVFATTVFGGMGYLIKTYFDGKNRADAVVEALRKAENLQVKVNELEAAHKVDVANYQASVEWMQRATESINGKVNRNRQVVRDLAEQVDPGSSDAIPTGDTAIDLEAMPKDGGKSS